MSGEWRHVLPEDERAIYERAGYGAAFAPGTAPVLMIIDATINFTDEKPLPILESIARNPNSCGLWAWDSLAVMADLLSTARETPVPVIYTHGPVVKNSLTLGGWSDTRSGAAVGVDQHGETFAPIIQPKPGDLVLEKYRPSAFFGTPLTSILTGLKIDTLVVCGGTTSGCIRASVSDAFSSGFRTIVVEEGTFDRARTSHLVNLYEMDQKYATVWSAEQAKTYLAGVAGREVSAREAVV